MEAEKILDKLLSLPAEAQQEVADFIAFLQTRYPSATNKKVDGTRRKRRKRAWKDEPFFGIWKNREEMQDSVAWVRKMREEQWKRRQ